MISESEYNVRSDDRIDGGVNLRSNADQCDVKGGDNEVVCRVRLGKCVVHGCEAKSVKISSKKWRWIERKKERVWECQCQDNKSNLQRQNKGCRVS